MATDEGRGLPIDTHFMPVPSFLANRLAERLASVPGTGGNEVDLLIDGEATFESILDGINKATDYVLMQFYIVRNDELVQIIQ